MQNFFRNITRPLERKINYKIKIKDEKYRLYLSYNMNKSLVLKAIKKFNQKTKQGIELSEGKIMIKPELYKYLKHQLTKTIKKIEKKEKKIIQEKHSKNFVIMSAEIGTMSFDYREKSNFVLIEIMVYGICYVK